MLFLSIYSFPNVGVETFIVNLQGCPETLPANLQGCPATLHANLQGCPETLHATFCITFMLYVVLYSFYDAVQPQKVKKCRNTSGKSNPKASNAQATVATTTKNNMETTNPTNLQSENDYRNNPTNLQPNNECQRNPTEKG